MRDGDIEGRIILQLIFKSAIRVWTGLIWLRTWTDEGFLCSNEPSSSIKCEEVLE
jgi:hypothetical protein